MIKFILGNEGWYLCKGNFISKGISGELMLFNTKSEAEKYLQEKELSSKLVIFTLEIKPV